jgi:hypothetical protein
VRVYLRGGANQDISKLIFWMPTGWSKSFMLRAVEGLISTRFSVAPTG